MFYIQQDEKIVLFDENLETLQNTIAFMPQYQGLEILETDREIIELNNEFVFADEVELKLAEARKEEFLKQFFKIDAYGYFRKQPKGYGLAVESLNTAFNIVTVLGNLPANTLTFYAEPDFTIAEQCTEEWITNNSYKNKAMTLDEFAVFYTTFITAWNTQEHL